MEPLPQPLRQAGREVDPPIRGGLLRGRNVAGPGPAPPAWKVGGGRHVVHPGGPRPGRPCAVCSGQKGMGAPSGPPGPRPSGYGPVGPGRAAVVPGCAPGPSVPGSPGAARAAAGSGPRRKRRGRLAYRRAVPPLGEAGVLPRRAPERRGRARAGAGKPRPRLGPRVGGSWRPVSGGLWAPLRGWGALAALRPSAAPHPAPRRVPLPPALSGGPAKPWAAAPTPAGGGWGGPQAARLESAAAPGLGIIL